MRASTRHATGHLVLCGCVAALLYGPELGVGLKSNPERETWKDAASQRTMSDASREAPFVLRIVTVD